MPSTSPFEPYIARYLYNCELFVKEVLGVKEPYPWQCELMQQYDKRTRYMAVKSGHGVGKSTVLSWLMVHHLLMRYPQKTVVTAPSTTQLWDALWASFKSCLTRLPATWLELLEVRTDRVVLKGAPDFSFVSARTSRAETPEALSGVHADQSLGTDNEGVLLIADEASGVPDPVFEAAIGSMSGHRAMTILCGNPVRLTGFFHEALTENADIWWTKTVSCFDVPQAVDVVSYVLLVTRSYGKNSNPYRVRVLGEFPTTESDSIIPFDLVEAALDRDVKSASTTAVVWGVDPARFGDDRSALAKRRGAELLERVKWWLKKDTMELAGLVQAEYHAEPVALRPTEINVDAIGIGAGVVDRLRQLGLPARGINVSESPALMSQEKYRDLRTELWFKGREWFARRDCKLPASYRKTEPEDDLIKQLTAQKYDYAPQSGKVFALSKKDMKTKYGVDSPDLADAFILTLASDAMRLTHGRYATTSWAQPLHRPLKLLQTS